MHSNIKLYRLLIFSHVLRLNYLGVDNQLILPQSADYDHVNCASVGDFDFDGRQELVLGTFGQRLLFYHWNSTERSATHKSLGSYSKPPMEMPMEALYFPSQAQSNSYNLTFVKSSMPVENLFPTVLKYDLLVAYYRPVADSLTTKECFMLYRFSSDSHGVNTTVKSLDFVYLPGSYVHILFTNLLIFKGDCNIACISALQDCLTGEYIVGIGFVTDQSKGYLNIYGSRSQEKLSGTYMK
ncbi:hypothetical protein AHF37_05075 [Paragonimus kellicotti]|nr:hypothetical protein AHF37_05075 [Paragonimus kellicotti]